MGADNAVFAGVISWRAVKNMDTDLLLRCILRGIADRTFRNIEQKFP